MILLPLIYYFLISNTKGRDTADSFHEANIILIPKPDKDTTTTTKRITGQSP
jgi:hypothetical protein